jgi:hypothetical protein
MSPDQPPLPSTDGKARRRLAALLLLALGLRIAHFLYVRHAIVLEPRGYLDDAFYYRLASLIAGGDLAAGTEAFFLPPLYAYFLGALFALFRPGLDAPFLVQAVLGTLAVGIVYDAGRRAEGEAAGLIAGLLLAFDGLAVMYGATLLAAALDPFLSALFFWALVRAITGSNNRDWALAGAALGLFALNRPNALLLLPAVAALPFLWPRTVRWSVTFNRPSALACATLVAAALIAIAPFTIRNYLVSGRFTLLSSHGGLNFYIGNWEGANGGYSAPDWLEPDVRGQVDGARQWLSAELRRPVAAEEVSALLYRRVFDEMAADPAGWLRLAATKARLLLAGREAGLNLSLGYLREAFSPALWLAPVGMWLLLPLGIAGAVAARRRRPAMIVAGFALVFAFSVWVFFVSDRYRLPLHPPLAVLSGCGLAAVGEAVKQWRGKSKDGYENATQSPRRELALYLCVLAVAAVFAAWPIGAPSGDGQMRLMHALRLVEDGRIGEAEAVAEGMPPGAMNPFFWRLKMARALRAKGASAAAEAEYRRLLEIDPASREIGCELAGMISGQGRLDEAAGLCRDFQNSTNDKSGLK